MNKDIAQRMGYSAEYISQILNNKREITVDVLVGLKDKFGVSSDQILYGSSPETDRVAEPTMPYEAKNEFITIPQVSGRIDAGRGLVPDNTIETRIAFRKNWIQRKGSLQNMSLIRVIGDSMEPTLVSGDLILIDRGRNYVDPHGGIYAIVENDEIAVKRLQLLMKEGLR